MRTHLTPLLLAAALAGGAGFVGAQGARIDGTGAGLNAGAAAQVDGGRDQRAEGSRAPLAALPTDRSPEDTRVLGNRGNIVPDNLPGTLGGHVDTETGDAGTLAGRTPAANGPRDADEALRTDVQR